MKKLTAAVVAAALVLGAGAAYASQCPKLIKQGREAAAKMDANDAKVKGALAKLGEQRRNLAFLAPINLFQDPHFVPGCKRPSLRTADHLRIRSTPSYDLPDLPSRVPSGRPPVSLR